MRRLSSQVAFQRSSIFVTAIPDEQLAEKRPSLRSLPSSRRLRHGVLLRRGFGGKAAHAAGVHDERWSVGDGRRDDAADEDHVVAAVVLRVHRALERGGRAVEQRRPDEPARDRRARRTSPRPCFANCQASASWSAASRCSAKPGASSQTSRLPEPRSTLQRTSGGSCETGARLTITSPASRPSGCGAVTTTTPVAHAPVARSGSSSTEASGRVDRHPTCDMSDRRYPIRGRTDRVTATSRRAVAGCATAARRRVRQRRRAAARGERDRVVRFEPRGRARRSAPP